MMPDMKFETGEVTLKPGDRIVMYTDGITEAMDTKEEEFGEERLQNTIQKWPDLSAQDLMDKIGSEVKHYSEGAPQADDITMVVLKATFGS